MPFDLQVAELTLAGLTQPEIAAELGISVNQVRRSRRRTGARSPHPGYAPGPPIDEERVVALTKQNYTAAQISAILGCAKRSVQRVRARAGIAQPAPRRLTDEQLAIADRLITDGASIAEAARTIGCGVNTLYRHFKGRGFTHSEIGQHSQLMRSMRRRGLKELIA